ncbi:MAG: deoxyguanosinetriphosphate triphosphohydrolase [Pseudomonadota bacterium]
MTNTSTDSLAPYAARALAERNRLIDEPETPQRGPFRRDRDRIVHAQAFRRLAHKTQVFITEEGDHYRTRLTHTIEVAQIARSLARNLALDTDLTEALALAHDLGHTPFGHTGEDALAAVMQPFGGFEHNAQTLRIVTKLEQRYAAFDGLNLTLETLGGIIKHNGPVVDDNGKVLDPKLSGVLPFALTDFMIGNDLTAELFYLDQHGSLEAQVAAISDDIAYNTHDIDDGVRAGFFALDDLRHVALVDGILKEVDTAHPQLAAERRMGEFTRRLITKLIMDVEATTGERLAHYGVETAQDVRHAGKTLGVFSDPVAEDVWMIKAFLFKTVYRNTHMMELRGEADRVLRELFDHFFAHPSELPIDWRLTPQQTANDASLARAICDFIAGMTDRYALNMHARLFDDTPDLRYGAAI